MTSKWTRVAGLAIIALTLMLLAWFPFHVALAQAHDQQHFKGMVVPVAEVLEKQKVKMDKDAGPTSLALIADNGTIYALIKNDGSRMLFKDPELLRRPLRLTGRVIAGSNLLQVSAVHSYVDGKVCEVFYWCEMCQLSDTEPGICKCCGAVLERRELPVD